VATWQTLVQKDNLKNDLWQEEFKLIIADEAHQASADS
jgi:superfamily II DNA or RNA helicase